MFIRSLAVAILFFSGTVLFTESLTAGISVRFDENSGWHHFETRHTIIYFQSMEDLKQFDRKILYYNGKWGALGAIFRSNSDTPHEIVRKKVDGIFEKVQQLLDMRKRMDKVRIYICRDKKQIQANYYQIYGKRGQFRAWYVYDLNAVYVNCHDVDEGMLSHELAHSIIDNYLLVRPPRASAEILASYVDLHLFE